MNKFFLFFLFLAVAVGPVLADEVPLVQTLYGTDAKVAFNGENVDFETFATTKTALLSSPADEAGNPTLTAVYLLFKGDKDAVGMTISIDGVGLGYLSIVDTSVSKPENIQEIIFPIGDLRENENGKKFVKIVNPAKYMDQHGNIEVHISVCGGQAFTLNSISVEFEKNKTEAEFGKEVNLVVRRFTQPPGVPEILFGYHHGSIWIWGESSRGKAGWVCHEWGPKTPPIKNYIFHFQPPKEEEK